MNVRSLLQWGAVVGALALVLFLAGADSASAATTFNPELKIKLDNTTPETPSNFTGDFNLPKGDVNFAAVVSFIPKDWGVVKGDKIKINDDVGHLSSKATLGLVNSACYQVVDVAFDMKNASLDRTDTVSFEDTDNNNTADYADTDANGVYKSISKYPEFLNRLFKDLQPIRRSAGITPVAGIPILLQFLVFPPGTVINEAIPHDKALGYPSVTVLQNIGDPDAKPQPGAITDFCTPLLSTNISFGTTKDGSTKLFVNPKDGKYTFTTFALGQRDADGDGYENSLDTCPFIKNVGDPRIPGSGDADNDGLDAACDPNDNDPNSDQDGDGYSNRQDNCPLVANGEDLDNQHDRDLDQIGDACDPNPDKPDGELSVATPTVDIKIGTGTGAGGPPSEQACPDCYHEGQVTATPPPAQVSSITPTNDEGGGLGTGAIIGIIAGVAAAVVVIGGGATWMIRRRS